MSLYGRTRAWVRAIAMRGHAEREMHEEMAAHIAQATERFVARGMSAQDARLAAQQEFGNVGVVQEFARDARGGQWLANLGTDLKYAFRYFARTPLATVTMVLTLALGIGVSSAVFSAIIGIFTRPAPGVPDDPALVKIRGISNEYPFARPLSYRELSAYAAATDKFAAVAAWASGSVVVDAGDVDLAVVRAAAQFVTPNYFSVLGTRLATGHGFAQSRFGELSPPELTAIASHALATDRFGGPKAAIGKQVKVNDATITIIGVTPPRFNGAMPSGEARILWLPLSAWTSVTRVSDQVFGNPNALAFEAFARLQPNVSVRDALPVVQVIAARADAAAKAALARKSIATADVIRLRGPIDIAKRHGDEMGPVSVMFAVFALLVLLVCTTTVNSLLVGAAVARRYEIGVRLALGASRWRIVRQLLTEVAILAFAGAALGLWTFGALNQFIEVAQDGWDIAPHWETVTFTVLYSVFTAVLCGLSPALHATRAGLADVLKDSPSGATTRSRLQRTFVVAQIAIAQPMTVLLAAVLSNVIGEGPHLSNLALRERLLIAEFDYVGAYGAQAPGMIRALAQRFAGLPGVEAALPMGWGSIREVRTFRPVASTPSGTQASAGVFDVPPGYFEAVNAPMLRGRDFVASDTTLAVTPVIITDSLARVWFASSNPIGRRIAWGADEARVEVEVIGVVGVTQESNTLEYPPEMAPIYYPLRGPLTTRLLIRTAASAELLLPTVTEVTRKEARKLPVRRIGVLAQSDRAKADNRRGGFRAATGLGMLTLTLAAIGLYALMNITVGQRRREIGIRIALGARAQQVVMMFFKKGLRVTLVGLAIGLPLSVAGLALLAWKTPMTFNAIGIATLVTSVVVGVAALASWLPARRAARVDPMTALRS